MRKTIYVGAAVAVLCLVGSTAVAQDASQPPPAPAAYKLNDIPPPPAGKGQVVFFRPHSSGDEMFSYSVHEGDKGIAKLGSCTYFVQVTDPGVHEYTVSGTLTDSLRVTVRAGETVYVIDAVDGPFGSFPSLTSSTKDAFREDRYTLTTAAASDRAAEAASVREPARDAMPAISSDGNAASLESLVGAAVNPIAVAFTDKAVASTGTVDKGEVFLSVPFMYRHVVRAKIKIAGKITLLGFTRWNDILAKDVVGFEDMPARFRQGGYPQKVFCFFVEGHIIPACYLISEFPDGVYFYSAFPKSNLGTVYTDARSPQMLVPGKSLNDLFENDAEITDHRFQVDFVAKKWDEKAITFVMQSDATDVTGPRTLPFGTDGVARIALSNGVLALKPNGDGKLDVVFMATVPPTGN